MVFQIVDDIQDREEDLKTNKKNINQNYGLNNANKYLNEFKTSLIDLGLHNDFFEKLIQNLCQIIKNAVIN
jgi:hypothetical protein